MRKTSQVPCGITDNTPLSSAADVYRSLVDEGLMFRKNGTGRDDALWSVLVKNLGFPADTTDIPKALKKNATSIEE